MEHEVKNETPETTETVVSAEEALETQTPEAAAADVAAVVEATTSGEATAEAKLEDVPLPEATTTEAKRGRAKTNREKPEDPEIAKIIAQHPSIEFRSKFTDSQKRFFAAVMKAYPGRFVVTRKEVVPIYEASHGGKGCPNWFNKNAYCQIRGLRGIYLLPTEEFGTENPWRGKSADDILKHWNEITGKTEELAKRAAAKAAKAGKKADAQKPADKPGESAASIEAAPEAAAAVAEAENHATTENAEKTAAASAPAAKKTAPQHHNGKNKNKKR
jgi:hypothetical protein